MESSYQVLDFIFKCSTIFCVMTMITVKSAILSSVFVIQVLSQLAQLIHILLITYLHQDICAGSIQGSVSVVLQGWRPGLVRLMPIITWPFIASFRSLLAIFLFLKRFFYRIQLMNLYSCYKLQCFLRVDIFSNLAQQIRHVLWCLFRK